MRRPNSRIDRTRILAVLPLIGGGTRLCVVTEWQERGRAKVVDMDFPGLPFAEMHNYLFEGSNGLRGQSTPDTDNIRNLILREVSEEQSRLIMERDLMEVSNFYTVKTVAEFNHLAERGWPPSAIKVSSPNCGPCKVIAPKWKVLGDELVENAYFIEIDATECEPELIQILGVRSVPLFLVYKGGEEVKRGIGIDNYDIIRDFAAAKVAP